MKMLLSRTLTNTGFVVKIKRMLKTTNSCGSQGHIYPREGMRKGQRLILLEDLEGSTCEIKPPEQCAGFGGVEGE
jgi:hypothetical protein